MKKRPVSFVGSSVAEFDGVNLGDARRVARLSKVVAKLAAAPGVGFPRALVNESDLEGFYRLLRNKAVSFESLLSPHTKATVERMAGLTEVLAVHDSSEFHFAGKRKGLGVLKQKGQGFTGHFTLAVTADGSRAPLGMLATELWARTQPTMSALRKEGKIPYRKARQLPNEQDRWLRGVSAAEAAIGNKEGCLIHVMDSEADDYDIMTQLLQDRRRWVIRLCQDRALAQIGATKRRYAKEFVAKCKVVCSRRVHLSRRGRTRSFQRRRQRPRPEREAVLDISATSLAFKRPQYGKGPASICVNVVCARERNAPKGEEPVEWILITTEPIKTRAQILKVVDIYRARWVIEEFFKALKTGCAFEKRQLESWHTLRNALGMFIPIAWQLLHLRTLARQDGDAPARTVLTPMQETVLRRASKTKLPRKLTTKKVMLAIAALGGHLRSNGEPGWLVLGRGFQDLLMLVAGYQLGVEKSEKEATNL
jgi:hypothetical protein